MSHLNLPPWTATLSAAASSGVAGKATGDADCLHPPNAAAADRHPFLLRALLGPGRLERWMAWTEGGEAFAVASLGIGMHGPEDRAQGGVAGFVLRSVLADAAIGTAASSGRFCPPACVHLSVDYKGPCPLPGSYLARAAPARVAQRLDSLAVSSEGAIEDPARPGAPPFALGRATFLFPECEPSYLQFVAEEGARAAELERAVPAACLPPPGAKPDARALRALRCAEQPDHVYPANMVPAPPYPVFFPEDFAEGGAGDVGDLGAVGRADVAGGVGGANGADALPPFPPVVLLVPTLPGHHPSTSVSALHPFDRSHAPHGPDFPNGTLSGPGRCDRSLSALSREQGSVVVAYRVAGAGEWGPRGMLADQHGRLSQAWAYTVMDNAMAQCHNNALGTGFTATFSCDFFPLSRPLPLLSRPHWLVVRCWIDRGASGGRKTWLRAALEEVDEEARGGRGRVVAGARGLFIRVAGKGEKL